MVKSITREPVTPPQALGDPVLRALTMVFPFFMGEDRWRRRPAMIIDNKWVWNNYGRSV